MTRNPILGDKYKICLVGRSGVRYSEGGKTVEIPGEMLVGDPRYEFVLYCDANLAWSTLTGQELVGAGDWRRIEARVSEWFKGRVEWQWANGSPNDPRSAARAEGDDESDEKK
jgi:hypothetical protein